MSLVTASAASPSRMLASQVPPSAAARPLRIGAKLFAEKPYDEVWITEVADRHVKQERVAEWPVEFLALTQARQPHHP